MIRPIMLADGHDNCIYFLSTKIKSEKENNIITKNKKINSGCFDL